MLPMLPAAGQHDIVLSRQNPIYLVLFPSISTTTLRRNHGIPLMKDN